jgi:hypothetical protein
MLELIDKLLVSLFEQLAEGTLDLELDVLHVGFRVSLCWALKASMSKQASHKLEGAEGGGFTLQPSGVSVSRR